MIVLIAHDVEENGELLSRLVQLHGHDPVIAADGREAISQARKHLPDLIFLDTSMPDMPGIELVSLIRKDAVLANTPIVAFEPHATVSDCDEGLAVVCDEVMTGELDIAHLQSLIDHYASIASGGAPSLEARYG